MNPNREWKKNLSVTGQDGMIPTEAGTQGSYGDTILAYRPTGLRCFSSGLADTVFSVVVVVVGIMRGCGFLVT